MVKQHKKQQRPAPKSLGLPRAGGKRLQANAARVGSSMDMATARYLRLLDDPCAADLVPPTYGGTGSGYLMRTKQFVTLGSSVVDGTLEYTPSWGDAAIRLTTSNTVGGALGFVSSTAVPSQLTTLAECFRPIAACVKVFYTGSEMNRSGMAYGNLLDSPSLNVGEAPVTNSMGYAVGAARFVRIGSEMHEYRWCPNEADQTFGSISTATPSNALPIGSTLQVGFTGAYAGTVSFEITTVWEWQPKSGLGSSSAIVSTPRAPVTPLALNATLHRIGNLAEWATKPKNQHRMLEFARGAYNSVKMIKPALAALAL